MPFSETDPSRAALTALALVAVLALAALALPAGRRAFHVSLIAAGAAFLTTLGFWALSPQTAWTGLLFQLFPGPALDESARLIALFALPATALAERRAPLFFALGFAAFEAGVIAWGAAAAPAGTPALLAPLVALALHLALGAGALAMQARRAPPMLIFCVLALAHGAHNGALIAGANGLSVWAMMAGQAGLIVFWSGLAWLLLRDSDALRGEDRRLD